MKALPDTNAAAVVAQKLDAAANAAAAVTISASSEDTWVIDWIAWSYDDAPTGGKLSVANASGTVLETDITDGGPGILVFGEKGVAPGSRNEAVTVTLAAGGAGVTGKLTLQYR